MIYLYFFQGEGTAGDPRGLLGPSELYHVSCGTMLVGFCRERGPLGTLVDRWVPLARCARQSCLSFTMMRGRPGRGTAPHLSVVLTSCSLSGLLCYLLYQLSIPHNTLVDLVTVWCSGPQAYCWRSLSLLFGL